VPYGGPESVVISDLVLLPEFAIANIDIFSAAVRIAVTSYNPELVKKKKKVKAICSLQKKENTL